LIVAIRWAVANGNWANALTWNGGTFPAVDDDVFADGWSVTINQNINVLSLNTTQRSGGTNGGGFTVNQTGLIINCETINTGGGTCLRMIGSALHLLTINVGTVNAAQTNNTVTAIDHQNTAGTIIVNASIINGGGGAGSVSNGVRNNSSGILIVNCLEARGGNGLSGAAIANSSTGSLTVNGNAVGGGNATAYGITNASTGPVTLNGIAIASNNAEAVNNASTGTFTIAAARHAPNGRSPWTGNGRVFFSNLDLAHVTVNNAAHVQRMLGRRLLAPLGNFDGGFHG
jgi:hypothetical protein